MSDRSSPAPLMVAPFRLDSLRDPAAAPAAPPTPPPRRGDKRRARADSRRRRRSRLLVTLLVVLALLVVAAGVFAGVRLSAADPAPVVSPVVMRPVTVAPSTPALPWPQVGQGAIAIPALGVDVGSGPEQAAPVASLTKLMTAYVILHDHPLDLGQSGPDIPITQAAVDDYNTDTVNDDSNAQVLVGEQITEAQVLGGMLVHSADNYADLLATWDAGSVAAFVAKMNAEAARLGMHHSHFADPSGVSPGSESTASDLLRVAGADMTNPVFAGFVQMSSITLPVAGTISTYTPLLGLQGIVGVKSGFTTVAGGCDIVAVVRPVHGQPTLLLAAVTGQVGPDVLVQAGLHGLALVNAVQPLVGTMSMLRAGQLVAHVSEAGHTVEARAAGPVTMLTWPGVTARRAFHPARHLTDQARRGAAIGTVVVTLGRQRVVVPVRLQRDVPRPTLLQRLF